MVSLALTRKDTTMLLLPPDMIALLMPFAPLFSPSVFLHAQWLLVGALLAPGKRTVTAALRATGHADDPHFQNYHRVLNRARWSCHQAARLLLGLLVATLAPAGPLLVGIDETLERRKGKKIAPKGVYRDAARSSKEYLTKASGLRWISMMLLVSISWAGRVWALPFFTVLAPSERYHQQRGRPHKTLADWARQMIGQLRNWLPDRDIYLVADSEYAVIDLLAHALSLAQPVFIITRLRLDAGLYAPAPPRRPGTMGRPRVKGKRLPKLEQVALDPQTAWRRMVVARWYSQGARDVEIVSDTGVWYHPGKPVVPLRWVLIRDPKKRFRTQALLCTDRSVSPEEILSWFVLRWQLETTFEEVRAHLGVETQRQWNDLAIVRTTPVLLGLFSLVTLWADRLYAQEEIEVRQAAWYVKERPTFSDAMAAVRRQLWPHAVSCISASEAEMQNLPFRLLERFADTLCYAA
jgi:DDE superfamily endonuclease